MCNVSSGTLNPTIPYLFVVRTCGCLSYRRWRTCCSAGRKNASATDGIELRLCHVTLFICDCISMRLACREMRCCGLAGRVVGGGARPAQWWNKLREHACLRLCVIGNQLSGKISARAQPDILSRGKWQRVCGTTSVIRSVHIWLTCCPRWDRYVNLPATVHVLHDTTNNPVDPLCVYL